MSDEQEDTHKETSTTTKTTTKVTFPELGYESIQDFIQAVFKGVVQTTQTSNGLPAVAEEQDHGYWESFDMFKDICGKQGTRILNNIGDLLQHSAIQCKWGANHLPDKSTADIEEQFDKLVDANDILLENVGYILDEVSGVKKNAEKQVLITASLKPNSTIVSSWNKNKDLSNKSAPYKLLMAKNIHRPQLNWLDKIDNRNIPFIPYLKYKANALNPPGGTGNTDNFDQVGGSSDTILNSSKHPYHYELTQFEPSERQLEVHTPKMYLPLEETNLTYVDSPELLDKMLSKLRKAKEIAVDLEHHNYRSFQGVVCLIQISTRKEDFIIDPFKLREELSELNGIFTNPNILKILHGSDADIGWLQRDFGVYMVNMFDTGQASRTLQEARFSLAHLLQKYCNVTAQKQYQLADWRIRPLPAEMLRYAREDTHYLIYVYDILRNDLITRGNEMKNLLRMVYTKSTALCATLYKKQLLLPDSHMTVYQKYRKRFNPQQLECFRLLYTWRDTIARQEDESTGYILPNHMMFQIAEMLPRDQQGVIACCNPVPPLVNQHVADIEILIRESKNYDPEQEDDITDSNDIAQVSQISKETNKFQLDSCDPRSGFEIYPITGPKVKTKHPTITVFDVMLKEHLEMTAGKRKANDFMEMLKSPFEIYLPNTGTPSVDPKEINQKWQTVSVVRLESEPALVVPLAARLDNMVPLAAPLDHIAPLDHMEEDPPTSHIKKKKRRKHGLDDDIKSLREMCPKKAKKQKPLSEHLDDLIETRGLLPENMPVKLDYEKNKKMDTDYVPFDYSKADLKKFSAGLSSSSTSVNLDKTEEPNFRGPINTKVRSGARQMTF